MLATLRSGAVFGVEAYHVLVEVDVSFGLPCFTMVGLPDASVRESRDRVRAAIRNSGFEFPPHRITVNLAPADIRKAGSAFDLPIALGVLAAAGTLARRDIPDWLIVGELSLDGAVQPARGVLPIAVSARRERMTGLLLPSANYREAAVVSDLRLAPVATLAHAVDAMQAPDTAGVMSAPAPPAPAAPGTFCDFADVRGQAFARRAMEVAAAGAHNALLIGPPGAGKTMMARRLPGILPAPTFDEALEVTAIHSVAGVLPTGSGLIAERPFRAPHHTISEVALVGGRSIPHPGEISLAHNGVLFLDEMPEFDRRVLEVLRQPLEEGCVRIARAARTATFPARFILMGAMNPCPCGFAGHPVRACRCPPQAVARYAGRLSGPLRDRIDLIVHVPPLTVGELCDTSAAGESSAAMRARVVAARECQRVRLEGSAVRANGSLEGRLLRRHCRIDAASTRLLTRASETFCLSARAHDRVLRVARTIADLAGRDAIVVDDVAEALQFREVASLSGGET